jgi:hypothetical protein
MFFKKQKMVIDFFFNHLVDGIVRKLLEVEGQGLSWQNGSIKMT